MNKIYQEIAGLTDKFRTMAYGITQDENKINNAVQELMLYFLQMNPETLRNIYKKDGIDGVTRYGAVALRRFLTSKRSSFYYKYDKYYRNLATPYVSDSTIGRFQSYNFNESIYNLAEDIPDITQWEKLETIDNELDKLNWYDRELFKLYYYEGNTLDSLADKTRISRNSLFTTIDKVRTILKKQCNEIIQSEDKE
jgi:hypothetical protein|tara:strand:+ start:402 stop:989 length:588 start_codon:yes stop_codon:yes gene_type:complete